MGRGEDRISNLPNEILQSILCRLPLKYAIRTSALSKTWVHLWQCNLTSSTSLLFGADFSCNQSPKQFVTTLDRYLQLHGDRNLNKFGILFSPFEIFFPNVENWIRIVLEKGVKQLDIDLSQGVLSLSPYCQTYIDDRKQFVMPSDLSNWNTLTRLSLSRCDISDTFDMTNFIGLTSISLDHANLTDEMLVNILESCVSLNSISLKRCDLLGEVKFVGDKLKLQKLVMVDCQSVHDMQMSVPTLKSFVYHGSGSVSHYFNNVSNVTDAYLCSVGVDDTDEEMVEVLSDFSHVKALTVCSSILKNVVVIEEYTEDVFPIELRNLQEFQIILDSKSEEHLYCVFSVFRLCPAPFLEKLFIKFPSNLDRQSDLCDWVTAKKDTPDLLFQDLKWIKITNFEGSPLELKLVKYFLEKAIILESIFLVVNQCEKLNDSLSLKIVQGQLSVLSKDAQIVLCGSSDRDCIINPTHTNYGEERYRNGTTVHLYSDIIRDENIILDQEFY